MKRTRLYSPRFMIAKYIENVARMEPRNIGIVAWLNGTVDSRFLAVTEISFVRAKKNYSRWVDYWMCELGKPELIVPRRQPVLRTDPEYLKYFQATGEGNYQFGSPGEVLDDVPGEDLGKVVDYLFSELVLPRKRNKPTLTA